MSWSAPTVNQSVLKKNGDDIGCMDRYMEAHLVH